MSRLLLITLEYPPVVGGVGRMYQELCRALRPDEVTVWAPPLTRRLSEVPEPYELIRKPLLTAHWWPTWLPLTWKLSRQLKQRHYDGVVVGQVLPLGSAVWLLSRLRPLRYAVFVHNMDISVASRVPRRRWLIRHILTSAHQVLAANQYVADLVITLGIPAERITVIYPSPVLVPPTNPSVAEQLRRTYQLSTQPIILTIARLIERKGQDIVLSSLERIWGEFPDCRYVIIGEGPGRTHLKVLKATLSRPEQVHFLGVPPEAETTAWLSLATVFVMTPRSLPNGDVEGLGIVFLEAGRFGKPVVGSRSGGVPEGIRDGQTGFLVPPDDIPATAEAILKLLRDESLRQRFGQAGAQFVGSFTANRGAAQLRRVFANYD